MAWQEKNFYLQVFKKTYLLGYSKNINRNLFSSGLWFASSNNYAVALEDVLRRIPRNTKLHRMVAKSPSNRGLSFINHLIHKKIEFSTQEE